jgi:hypothetical protein
LNLCFKNKSVGNLTGRQSSGIIEQKFGEQVFGIRNRGAMDMACKVIDDCGMRYGAGGYGFPRRHVASVDPDIEPSLPDVTIDISPRRSKRVDAIRARRAAKRARFEQIAFAIIGSLAAAATIWTATVVNMPQSAAVPLATVTVAPGDTLWSLAARVHSSGESTTDTIALIKSANPSIAAGQSLQPGETVVVPGG